MKMVDYLIAFRYLRSKKRTKFVSVISAFSFIGIMLGVATLIIVMSVMNGFRQELMERILGLNGVINIYPTSGPTMNMPNLKNISQIAGIEKISPVLDGQIMASSAQNSTGAVIRGMTLQDFKTMPLLVEKYQGLDLSSFEKDNVILGYRFAQKMGLRIGDEVNLLSPNGHITAFGSMPRMKSYTVMGFLNTGMFEYDSNFIIMPLSSAQKYLLKDGQVSKIDIFLKNNDDMKNVRQMISGLLSEDMVAVDWTYSNSAFFNALEVEKNVMFLILTLIIIVAAFNIISGLIMLVQDKTKDIAILRTMGISRWSVMKIFMICGLTIGGLGTILGVGLGVLFCQYIEEIRQFLGQLAGRDLFSAEIYYLSQLPAQMNISQVIFVASLSLGLSFVATLYPSWKAGKTDPVEALSYE